MIKNVFLCALLPSLLSVVPLYPFSIVPKPLQSLYNPHKKYGRISGVDFHPSGKQYAITYRGNSDVAIYDLADNGTKSCHRQTLKSKHPNLTMPHGIAYHPTGKFLAVSYFINDKPKYAIALYKYDKKQDKFLNSPIVFIPPAELKVWAPHGIAFSPQGDCLAVTYCDHNIKKGYEDKLVLHPFDVATGTLHAKPFAIIPLTTPVSFKLPNPKGITFSRDGAHIVVTMGDTDTVVVYNVDKTTYHVNPTPQQSIQANLSRPEDVKFSSDGNYIAVTNSTNATVTIYGWDKTQSRIVPEYPLYTLKNPEAEIFFPHGIAFSPQGSLMAVTHYGIALNAHVQKPTKREDKVTFYSINFIKEKP